MVQNVWILDVLADLETFASANGLTALAEQLEDSRLIAAAEIESRNAEGAVRTDGEFAGPGKPAGGFGGQQRA